MKLRELLRKRSNYDYDMSRILSGYLSGFGLVKLRAKSRKIYNINHENLRIPDGYIFRRVISICLEYKFLGLVRTWLEPICLQALHLGYGLNIHLITSGLCRYNVVSKSC